jgi:hypothetical protein
MPHLIMPQFFSAFGKTDYEAIYASSHGNGKGKRVIFSGRGMDIMNCVPSI